MFGLTLVDHLRLTFGHVIYTHQAHSEAAKNFAHWDRWLKAGEALLLVATALTAVAVVRQEHWAYGVSTATTASLALCLLILRLALNFDAKALAHRGCSARLWHIREQYRALLADLQDGAITVVAARDRRDALMNTLHGIYENAPPTDRRTYEAARKIVAPARDMAITDEEIDKFLPLSMQKKNEPLASTH